MSIPKALAALVLGLLLLGLAWRLSLTPPEPEPAPGIPPVRNAESPPEIPGRWHRVRPLNDTLTPEQREKIERLESIGYVGGSRTPRTEEVVPVYDRDRAYPGLNFYTSGHAPGAILMDMEGKVLHTWTKTLREIWPDPSIKGNRGDQDFWRRARLLPNGDVLGIFEGVGIFKLDRDSNLIWSNANGAHHDMWILDTGEILVLTREAHVMPRIHPTEPVLEDFISVLDPDGKETSRLSLIECMENSHYKEQVEDGDLGTGDVFHTNTLFWIDGSLADRAPWLARGNILTSFCAIHSVAVIDPRKGSIEELWSGLFRYQHDPRLLADGSMMVFDNQGGPGGLSRVIDFDPIRRHVTWIYEGTEEDPLSSPTLGTARRLPNGNVLITESDNGRSLEITWEKELVWEFYNPHRYGDFIATLFELVRLPRDFPLDWLDDEK